MAAAGIAKTFGDPGGPPSSSEDPVMHTLFTSKFVIKPGKECVSVPQGACSDIVMTAFRDSEHKRV